MAGLEGAAPWINSRRFLAALSLSYGVLICFLLDRLPLWVDEVIQLLGTKGQSLQETIRYATENPGASPLGYLAQSLFVNTLGYSVVTARLSAALFSVLSCLAVAWLAREIDLRWTSAALVLFMALPLQFRYALEGRPYSQIVFMGAAMTALLLRARREPGVRWTLAYALAVVLGFYTLPFLAFVPLAHLLWVCLSLSGAERRGALVRVLAATVAGGLLYAPWYLHTNASWRAIIVANDWHFVFTAKTPLMLLRELAGGGYWISCPLVVAAALGLASRRMTHSTKVLLVCITVIPIAGALAADAVFDYFLAVRQMVFMLPGLVLLAVEGLRTLQDRYAPAGAIALAALLTVALMHDAKWLSQPRENWQTAAVLLRSSGGPCLVFVPEESVKYYRFFEPALPARVVQARDACLWRSPGYRGGIAIRVTVQPQGYVRQASGRGIDSRGDQRRGRNTAAVLRAGPGRGCHRGYGWPRSVVNAR